MDTVYIFSPKPQVGKTSIATNLAYLDAKKNNLVCVLELNRYSAFSPFLNGKIKEDKSIKYPLNKLEQIENNFVQSIHNKNLFYLSLSLHDNLLDLYQINTDYLVRVIEYCKNKFDKVFIDLPTGYLEIGLMEVIPVISEEDNLIIVIDENLETIHNLKQYDLYLSNVSFKCNNIHYIINKSVGLANETKKILKDNLFKSLNSLASDNEITILPFIKELIAYSNDGVLLMKNVASNKLENEYINSFKVLNLNLNKKKENKQDNKIKNKFLLRKKVK